MPICARRYSRCLEYNCEQNKTKLTVPPSLHSCVIAARKEKILKIIKYTSNTTWYLLHSVFRIFWEFKHLSSLKLVKNNTTLICSGCHKKISWAGGGGRSGTQTTGIYFLQSWRLEVQVQDDSKIGFILRPLLPSCRQMLSLSVFI